jgi:hypothetical protein
MPSLSIILSLAVLLMPLCTRAGESAGIIFSHNDWELTCDNTRTCRAAGYQSDVNSLSVSVLLTRMAGPGQTVTGKLRIGNYDSEEVLSKLPSTFYVSMKVNGRDFGRIAIRQDKFVADLTAKQVSALLAALVGNSTIEWIAGKNRWQLSDRGATAVFLKMDEFQGRVGTTSALVKKGPLADNSVLPPLPMPVVIAAPISKALPRPKQIWGKQSEALLNALRATVKEQDNCEFPVESELEDLPLVVTRLTDTKSLVSLLCWRAAYNAGEGYWVINHRPPYNPVLVTTIGSEYKDGHIHAAQKGRGLGDCWSFDGWTWDGTRFVHTESSSTGMCRLVAPGGDWELPEIITNVRR